MDVVFISPHYPAEMPMFTRGLAEVGARVHGLGDADPASVPPEVRRYLSSYVRVPDMRDVGGVVSRLRAAGVGSVDRVECLWEPHVTLAAHLRRELGAPGMDPVAIVGFRDKAVMKQRVAAAGLRVPRSVAVTTAVAAREAAEQIGFPLVVKPIAGAGTADTHRADDAAELEAILASTRHVSELSIEEYVDGDEFTYDAVVIAGEPAFESVTQYHPKPLIARNEQWVSPAQLTYRDPYRPELASGVELGRGVLAALGMQTGFVHLEWFRAPGGEAVFCEIAARCGGAKLIDMMNFANDFDVCREWARAVCWGSFEAVPARRYHVAVVFKRALGGGRITRIEGMDELRAFCGDDLVLDHLLPVGAQRRNWKLTLLSDGYVLVRHADYQRCVEMMERAVGGVRMFAG